ncbi:MAG: alanine racemase [Candidatus Omnitrophota bacterium]|jgi:alanine racemase
MHCYAEKKECGVMQTYIEINLKNIKKNLLILKRSLSKGVDILLVVKAEAYGHGMLAVAKYAEDTGLVQALGVTTADEALSLRKHRIKLPIITMQPVFKDEVEALIRKKITLTLSSVEEAAWVQSKAKQLNRRALVHAGIDTGMGRLGIDKKDALKFIFDLSKMTNIDLRGMYSHFPMAEVTSAESLTQRQIKVIQMIAELYRDLNPKKPFQVHMANSAAIMSAKLPALDMIRPGIAAFGIADPSLNQGRGFRPVLVLKTNIGLIKWIDEGQTISYACTYKTKTRTRVAIIPIGYSNGYPLALSNVGEVLIKGRRHPIIGRVTMDFTMIDIGVNEKIKTGDPVVLIGRSGSEEITVNELAQKAKTIPYDIVCALSNQIPRIYKQ